MKASNADIERAEEMVAQDAVSRIAAVSHSLKRNDFIFCVDCGEEIKPARKRAAPFAKRCVECQEAQETK